MMNSEVTTRVIAIMLALFLWSYVRMAHRTPDTVRVIRGVPVTVVGSPSGMVAKLNYDDSTIDVRIKGRTERVNSVPVEEVKARVDVSDISSAADARLPVEIDLPTGIALVGNSPKVTVTATPLERQTFPVNVSFIAKPPSGTTVGEYAVQPENVVVEGDAQAIKQVKYVTISVDPSESLTSERALVPRAVNGAGEQVKDVRVLASTVEVSMKSLTGVTRVVAVRVPPLKNVPRRYTVRVARVHPDVVTLSGPAAKLDSLGGYVETHEINVRNIVRDETRDVPIHVPSGLSLVGDTTKVRVDLEVQPVN